MRNTAEYLVLTAIALIIALYASDELRDIFLEIVNHTAQMITGGF